MVQVLPEVPNFNTLLAKAIPGAVQNLAEGGMQWYQNTQDKKVMEDIKKSESPEDMLAKYQSLSPQSKKEMQPLVDTLIKGRFAADAMYNKQAFKAQQKEAEEQKLKQELTQKIDKMRGYKNYVGSEAAGNLLSIVGKEGGEAGTWGGLNRKAVQTRAYVDAEGFWLADQTYTHFNKGTMSEAKLEQVREKLAPNSSNSEREYIARLDAIQDIIGLPKDIPSEKLDKYIDQKVKEVQKVGEKEKNIEQKRTSGKRSLEEVWRKPSNDSAIS